MGATDSNGKQSPVTADSITSDQIRGLYSEGHIDTDTAWDAIYNARTERGRAARERCAKTLNALALAESETIIVVEACS